jgi:hypothetical protein
MYRMCCRTKLDLSSIGDDREKRRYKKQSSKSGLHFRSERKSIAVSLEEEVIISRQQHSFACSRMISTAASNMNYDDLHVSCFFNALFSLLFGGKHESRAFDREVRSVSTNLPGPLTN